MSLTKALAYARVSTTKQKLRGLSIPRKDKRYSRVLSKPILRGMVDNAKKGFFRRTGKRRRSSFKDSCGNRNRKRCVGS